MSEVALTVTCAVTLVYMAAWIGWIIVDLCRSDRKSRWKQLKNFKQGKFALIFLAAVPLYFMAHLYNGGDVISSVWSTLESVIALVVLAFDYGTLSALAQASWLYAVAVNVCFTLVVANAVLFSAAFFGKKIVNAFALWRIKRCSQKVVLFVGDNEETLTMLSKMKNGQGRVAWMTASREKDNDCFLSLSCPWIPFDYQDIAKRIEQSVADLSKKHVTVIANTLCEQTNLLFAAQLTQLMKKYSFQEGEGRGGFNVYLYGETDNEDAFCTYVEESNGCLHYVNKSKRIALDFVERYPLTKFMTDRHLDTDRAILRENVSPCVVFVGFGQANKQLFLTTAVNHQFLTERDGELQVVPVRYAVYDGAYGFDDAALQHDYFRYDSDAWKDLGEEYLDMPPRTAREECFPFGADHPDFYKSLHTQLTDGLSYGYVVVDIGDDIQNVSLATKLQEKVLEWGLEQDVHVFVRVRDKGMTEQMRKRTGQTAIAFGCTEEVLYGGVSALFGADEMAKRCHTTYAWEYYRQLSYTEVEKTALRQWFTQYNQLQRDSNIYACLSIRMKLQMMGYDYVDAGDARADASEEFLQVYQDGCPIRYTDDALDGRRFVAYQNADFDVDCLRRTFAMMEHLRWNACMLAGGLVPATVREICSPTKGKDLVRRKHGNLTTFEGLKQYARLVAKAQGKTEEQTDVIRYDYRLMDNCAWLLKECGYKIVKKA